MAAKLLNAVLAQPRVRRLLSTEHFSVDGTLVEAWASMKSFWPKDGEPPGPGGRAEPRDGLPRPEAHQQDARLDDRSGGAALSQWPGKEAKLCFIGHALMENRNGLVVDACLTEATATPSGSRRCT